MKNTWEIIKDETGKIFREKGVFIYFLILPLVGTVAFGLLFSKRVGRDYPIAIVDQEISYGSRLARHWVDSTPELNVVSVVRTRQEAFEEMKRGAIVGIIELPASLERDLKSRKSIRVNVFVDSRNLVNANFVITAFQKAMGFGQAGIKFLIYKKLFPAQEAIRKILPVSFHSHPLGNPSVDYSFFVFTGILIMLIQQCILVGSTIGMTKEIELKTLEQTVSQSGGPFRYITIRSLVFAAFQIPILLMMLCIYFEAFKMPARNIGPLILLLLLFILSILSFSQVLGTFFSNRSSALQALIFFSMPAFFLSGYTWPIEDMPVFLRFFSYILPTTPVLNAWTRLTNIPDSLPYMGGSYLHQFLIFLFYFILGYFSLKRKAGSGRKTAASTVK